MIRLESVVNTFFCARPMLQMMNNKIAIEYLMTLVNRIQIKFADQLMKNDLDVNP